MPAPVSETVEPDTLQTPPLPAPAAKLTGSSGVRPYSSVAAYRVRRAAAAVPSEKSFGYRVRRQPSKRRGMRLWLKPEGQAPPSA